MEGKTVGGTAPASNAFWWAGILLWLVAASAWATGPAPPLATPLPMATRLQQLYEVSDNVEATGNARIAAIIAAYDRLFSADVRRGDWSGVANADLDILFKALREVGFHSGDPRHARDMARVLGQLQDRGATAAEHIEALHGLYVHARMLDEARALADAHPAIALERLPEIRQTAVPAEGSAPVWKVDRDQRLLIATSIEVDAPALILVASHPGCGFSRAAVEAIGSDAFLGPLFARHSRWLMPPATRLDFDRARQWNRDHPAMPLAMAVRRDDWPAITHWNTPTFYFFREGELVTTVTGWPLDGAGRRAELVGALHRVGLLD